jgi:redox-sensitive bicupin YhaK (pirin superfamily)
MQQIGITSCSRVLSPNPDDEGVWINQDAWFSMGRFDKDISTEYKIKQAGNGVYAFVLKGDFTIDGQPLNERDGYGVWDVEQINIVANSPDAELLLMDVPMKVS